MILLMNQKERKKGKKINKNIQEYFGVFKLFLKLKPGYTTRKSKVTCLENALSVRVSKSHS